MLKEFHIWGKTSENFNTYSFLFEEVKVERKLKEQKVWKFSKLGMDKFFNSFQNPLLFLSLGEAHPCRK